MGILISSGFTLWGSMTITHTESERLKEEEMLELERIQGEIEGRLETVRIAIEKLAGEIDIVKVWHLQLTVVALTNTDGTWVAGSQFSKMFDKIISGIITTYYKGL